MNEIIEINGLGLDLGQVIHVARGERGEHSVEYPKVILSASTVETIASTRRALLERIVDGDVMYGVNTGCGSKKGSIIPVDEIIQYQAMYIPAHSVAMGEPFSDEIVRAAMVLRVNSFAKGNSGISLELCEKILELYNAGVIPVVPQQGSVGSSGDLCLLAHIASALMGLEGQKVKYENNIYEAKEALEMLNIEPYVLREKEAMGITNGSTFQLAMGLLAIYDTKRLLHYSNIAMSMSLEAIRGEMSAFDKRIHKARNHESAVIVAETISEFLKDSERVTEDARKVELPAEKGIKKYHKGEAVPRVQDAYSFRAYATVAGSVLDALNYVEKVFSREINASTDNPLLFERKDGTFETLSGGNFHGEPLAQASDLLKIAVQQLANISDRRFYALLMPSTSYGLPGDLGGGSEYNTGFMIVQYTTASLVHENKILCTPSVIDSIPTSANQEDYVSMGTVSTRNLLKVVENTFAVIACEILAADRGIRLTLSDLEEFPVSSFTKCNMDKIEKIIPFIDEDSFWGIHMNKMKEHLMLKGL